MTARQLHLKKDGQTEWFFQQFFMSLTDLKHVFISKDKNVGVMIKPPVGRLKVTGFKPSV